MFAPQVDGFLKAMLNDLDSVRALAGDRTVAVMIKPIQGEAGVVPATSEFLIALREWTTREGLLMIFDEVQTGVGRTGRGFAFEHSGVMPDILTLGKGIGGGVPLAALLASDRAAVFEHGDEGGTYSGHALMTAVGLAVVNEVLTARFLAEVCRRGALLTDRLESLDKRYNLTIRGMGLLLAIDLARPIAGALVEQLREAEAVLVNSPRPHLLRLMPALNVTEGSIERFCGALDRVLRRLL